MQSRKPIFESGALLLGLLPAMLSGAPVADHELTLEQVPVREQAVGTVRPRSEAQVMAQASGQILAVEVREGARVEEGQLLARISDRELSLRLSQARHGVVAARAQRAEAEEARRAAAAALEQARAEFDRVKGFFQKKVATPQQLEAAEAAFKQAQAGEARAGFAMEAAAAAVKRAEEGVAEVEVSLAYTRVIAPMAGSVAARRVDPGDLAWPGRPLLELHTPDDLLLEAHVRAGLAGQLRQGQKLRMHVDALDQDFEGEVLEVVPLADPVSRKFTVKVALPRSPGLVPGMFGRLELDVGTREVLRIPAAAVTRIGQLDFVQVPGGSGSGRRLVRLGELRDGSYEVLAGLKVGEHVLVPGGAR